MSLLSLNTFGIPINRVLLTAETQSNDEDSETPDEFGQVGDVGQMSAPDGDGNCPPCMKLGKTEAFDEKGNRIEKDVCVPACDTATGEVCYIHPCVNKQGWTCLSPQSVAGGGSRIIFPSGLTTTCGEQGFTGNGKACPCIVCNNAVSISNCQGDCTTCGGVSGATNIGQGLNNQALCGNALGNVLVTGAGQGQGVVRTPPQGKQWGFIESSSGCNCPAGAQKVNDPATGRQKCANVGCTDPKADNYDSNATIACGEGSLYPNRCCTYPAETTTCNDANACNRHFTNGANMDCMNLGTNCEPICADSRSVDYAGWQAKSSAKTLKELYYYEESAKYDWSKSGKVVGTKEKWTTMTSKLSGEDSQARQTLANQAHDLFFKPCACPQGETWSNTYGKCVKLGCIDTRACNYDASAKADDGSCEFGSCTGCMIIGADNYDSNAKIPCDTNYSNDCCEKDACPDENSCQYDSFCGGPFYNSSNSTLCKLSACKSCKKGYKSTTNGVCIKCLDDDTDEECILDCGEDSNGGSGNGSGSGITCDDGYTLINGVCVKDEGSSLLKWGVVGLIVAGIIAVSAK